MFYTVVVTIVLCQKVHTVNSFFLRSSALGTLLAPRVTTDPEKGKERSSAF